MLDHRRRTTRRTALFADTLEDDLEDPLLPLPLRPLIAALLFSFSSLCRSLGTAFPIPDVPSRPVADLQITGTEYQRRISVVLSAAGQGRPLLSTPKSLVHAREFPRV